MDSCMSTSTPKRTKASGCEAHVTTLHSSPVADGIGRGKITPSVIQAYAWDL